MKEELKLFYFSSNYAMDFLFVVVTLNTISTEIKKNNSPLHSFFPNTYSNYLKLIETQRLWVWFILVFDVFTYLKAFK